MLHTLSFYWVEMKKSILFAIACCIFFISPSILPYLVSQPAAAEEADLDEAKQFALMFLANVAKINISAYTAEFSYSYTAETSVEEWDFFVRLNRGNESIGLALNIYNGVIVRFICYGEPLRNEPAAAKWTAARDILDDHATLLNASYCSQFASLLDQAVPDQTQTLKSGNLTFRTAANRFEWLYTVHDTEVSLKSFRIDVSDAGYLTVLLNWWGVMRIGSTEIAVSREQAINIALSYAQAYADAHGRTLEATTATLSYVRGSEGNRDAYAVYPEWAVDIGFEAASSTPHIFGYTVVLWADTGVVFVAHPQGVFGDNASQNSLVPLAVTVTTIAILAATAAIVYRTRRRKKVM